MCTAANAVTNCPATGPIANVTVELFNANTGTSVQSALTNGAGFYTFTSLSAGNYYLVETQPLGFNEGGAFPGNGFAPGALRR